MPQNFRKAAVEQDVLALARERVAHIYDLFDHVAVSFSGGKDSTVCLELALAEAETRGRLPLDVFFFDEEAIPDETEQYVRRRAADPRIALRWYCLPVKHRNACTRDDPFWWPWAPEARDRWVRPLPSEAITELAGFSVEPAAARLSIPDATGLLFDPHVQGRVCQILGVRADESLTRSRSVLRKQIDNYLIPYRGISSRANMVIGKPIYDWTTPDVWTAPRRFGWDVNAAYRLLDMAGVPPSQQRLAPPFGEEPLAALWTFQVCAPALWERMTARVPGVATAARYSRTSLYSHGGRAQTRKPEELSWPQYLNHLLDQHPAAERRQIATFLRRFIAQHYRKTSDPILADVPHPASGVSWQWMAQIASRGDLKRRKSAVGELGRYPNLGILLAKYRAALATEYGEDARAQHDNGHSTAQQIG